jgi:hypothetical protein
MRVLVACEWSGRVRDAFRSKGHDAWSCDLLPSPDMSYHLQGDVRELMAKHWPWDLVIAHPPCTYLSNSGVLRLYKDGKKVNGRDFKRWELMRQAAEFFWWFIDSSVPKLCVENPVMHRHAMSLMDGVTYDQIIHPWQFGEDASKATCLWLRNLPPLVPTKILPGGRKARRANQTPSGQNKLGPSPERAKVRGITYLGIAEAMAEQWGQPAPKET